MRLRYVKAGSRGYRRERRGRGFSYVDDHGVRLADAAELGRIKELVIPPAWSDVWVSAYPNAHLQAAGTDAAGRRQYLYHERFRAEQDAAKHEHVLDVARALPALRERVESDLHRRGLDRLRVLAAGARLLDLGFFRIGGEAYARENQTYGLTTLLRSHIACSKGRVDITYVGKSGKEWDRAVVDPPTCATLTALRRRKGTDERLFVYWDRKAWHEVRAAELNAYLNDAAGVEISAKDFRTWHATVLAAVALAVSTQAVDAVRTRRTAVSRAVKEVAHYMGNTPTVCRASYINPRVIELYEEGITIAPHLTDLGAEAEWGLPATHGAVEQDVIRLLTRPDAQRKR
ncbi:DNA topoisomerase IB [Streptomyces sp. NPDC060194]|uniref:DNA topoisomerase IB n=1 Tax=Streptomyces sp. NPDC060194 TaxID=3347069 RepID=UPI00365C8A52